MQARFWLFAAAVIPALTSDAWAYTEDFGASTGTGWTHIGVRFDTTQSTTFSATIPGGVLNHSDTAFPAFLGGGSVASVGLHEAGPSWATSVSGVDVNAPGNSIDAHGLTLRATAGTINNAYSLIYNQDNVGTEFEGSSTLELYKVTGGFLNLIAVTSPTHYTDAAYIELMTVTDTSTGNVNLIGKAFTNRNTSATGYQFLGTVSFTDTPGQDTIYDGETLEPLPTAAPFGAGKQGLGGFNGDAEGTSTLNSFYDNFGATGVLGDANFDGAVTFADFVTLSNNFGLSDRGFIHGDFNGDSSVSFADFVILSNNFGLSASPEELAAMNAFGATHVPEPSALALGAMGLIALAGLNRLRKKQVTLTH